MKNFVDIASLQLAYLLEEASYLNGKANDIIEFCENPILHNMGLSDIEKMKLKKIINKTKIISDILTKFRDVLREDN